MRRHVRVWSVSTHLRDCCHVPLHKEWPCFCTARPQGSNVSSEGPALQQMRQAVGRDHAEDVKIQVQRCTTHAAVMYHSLPTRQYELGAYMQGEHWNPEHSHSKRRSSHSGKRHSGSHRSMRHSSGRHASPGVQRRSRRRRSGYSPAARRSRRPNRSDSPYRPNNRRRSLSRTPQGSGDWRSPGFSNDYAPYSMYHSPHRSISIGRSHSRSRRRSRRRSISCSTSRGPSRFHNHCRSSDRMRVASRGRCSSAFCDAMTVPATAATCPSVQLSSPAPAATSAITSAHQTAVAKPTGRLPHLAEEPSESSGAAGQDASADTTTVHTQMATATAATSAAAATEVVTMQASG